ncbi:MAG: hypothetical protein K2R98_29870 [Gemmataceae bacterium]|nr:hypothetical protein [Gemmataceae bacterium]
MRIRFSAPLIIYLMTAGLASSQSTPSIRPIRQLGAANPNDEEQARWVAFSRDGKQLAVGHTDGTARIWQLDTIKESNRLTVKEDGVTRHVGRGPMFFAPDGRILFTRGPAAGNGAWPAVYVWDLQSGTVLRKLEGDKDEKIGRFSLAPDGRSIAVHGWMRTDKGHDAIRLFDVSSGKLIRVLRFPIGDSTAFIGPAKALPAHSTDGTILAWPSSDAVIRLWRMDNGKQIRELKGHRATITGIAFSPGGSFLASSAGGRPPLKATFVDTTVRLWDVNTGKQLWHADCDDIIESIAYAPDGKTIVACTGERGTVWEAASGKPLFQFEDGKSEFSHVAYAPNGKTIASAMSDGTTLLWSMDAPGESMGPPQELGPRELSAHWKSLAGDEAPKAYRAIWSFSNAPEKTLPFLRERLKPIGKEKPEHVRNLIGNLDNEDFTVREAATRELARIGFQAESALRTALSDSTSEEVRKRARQLLQNIDSWVHTEPEMLRTLRAIWVLERIGTAESREVLKTLAQGLPESRITQEAKSALR